MKHPIALLLVCSLLAGCDPTGPDEGGNVAIQFVVGSSSAAEAANSPPTASSVVGSAAALSVSGRNGVLTLDRIVLIVDELELEGHGDACRGRADDDDDDEEEEDEDEEDDDDHGRQCDFEAESFLLDLPVDGSGITVATELIPNGVYDELEFKVEDAELDRDDDRRVISMLEAELRSRFPTWPSAASALVEGTFLPTGGGQARPFQVFFDAEIKVELDLDPPLVVTDDGASRVLTVEFRPDLWFRRIDGSVVDLSALDFGRTGRVVRLDLSIERAFRADRDD